MEESVVPPILKATESLTVLNPQYLSGYDVVLTSCDYNAAINTESQATTLPSLIAGHTVYHSLCMLDSIKANVPSDDISVNADANLLQVMGDYIRTFGTLSNMVNNSTVRNFENIFEQIHNYPNVYPTVLLNRDISLINNSYRTHLAETSNNFRNAIEIRNVLRSSMNLWETTVQTGDGISDSNNMNILNSDRPSIKDVIVVAAQPSVMCNADRLALQYLFSLNPTDFWYPPNTPINNIIGSLYGCFVQLNLAYTPHHLMNFCTTPHPTLNALRTREQVEAYIQQGATGRNINLDQYKEIANKLLCDLQVLRSQRIMSFLYVLNEYILQLPPTPTTTAYAPLAQYILATLYNGADIDLVEYNKLIIRDISNRLHRPLPDVLPCIDDAMDMQLTDTLFQGKQIVDIFTNFPHIHNNPNKLVTEIVPGVAVNLIRTVVHLFPIFKNTYMQISPDNVIRIHPFDPSTTTYANACEVNRNKIWSRVQHLRSFVSFDGNYKKFMLIVKNFAVSQSDLLDLVQTLFHYNGLECSVVVAALCEANIGYVLPVCSMYNILSLLDMSQRQHINGIIGSECCPPVDQQKLNYAFLLDVESVHFIPNVNTRSIEHAIKAFEINSNRFEPINSKFYQDVIARGISIYALFVYILQRTKRASSNTDVLCSQDICDFWFYLVLYSDAPHLLKDLITASEDVCNVDKRLTQEYTVQPGKCDSRDTGLMSVPPKVLNSIVPPLLKDSITEHINNDELVRENFEDLIQVYTRTNNENLLRAILSVEI